MGPPDGEAEARGASNRAGSPGPLPPARLVRLALGFYGVLALVAVVWRELWLGRSLVLASDQEAIHWGRDCLLGLLAAAFVVGASEWFTRTTRTGRALADALAALLGPLALWHCLALALASGIGEEALFRGALQPHLGLFWASVVFALAHLVPRRELLPWTAFSFLAGLLLGGLYQATGNLVAPIVAHAGVNAVNLYRLTHRPAALG